MCGFILFFSIIPMSFLGYNEPYNDETPKQASTPAIDLSKTEFHFVDESNFTFPFTIFYTTSNSSLLSNVTVKVEEKSFTYEFGVNEEQEFPIDEIIDDGYTPFQVYAKVEGQTSNTVECEAFAYPSKNVTPYRLPDKKYTFDLAEKTNDDYEDRYDYNFFNASRNGTFEVFYTGWLYVQKENYREDYCSATVTIDGRITEETTFYPSLGITGSIFRTSTFTLGCDYGENEVTIHLTNGFQEATYTFTIELINTKLPVIHYEFSEESMDYLEPLGNNTFRVAEEIYLNPLINITDIDQTLGGKYVYIVYAKYYDAGNYTLGNLQPYYDTVYINESQCNQWLMIQKLSKSSFLPTEEPFNQRISFEFFGYAHEFRLQLIAYDSLGGRGVLNLTFIIDYLDDLSVDNDEVNDDNEIPFDFVPSYPLLIFIGCSLIGMITLYRKTKINEPPSSHLR